MNHFKQNGFEFIEKTTSDVSFKAYGRTLEELFVNSAKALFSVMCNISMVPKKKEFKISLSETPEELLYEWLSKLLVISDSEGVFLSDFKVKISPSPSGEYHLEAICSGDDVKPEVARTQVKAITLYSFKLKHTKKGYEALVVLDV